MWLAVVVLGLAFLAAVRQYGSALASRHRAHEHLRQAGSRYAENDLESAQRLVVDALAESPEAAGAVLQAFDFRLLGMPVAADALAEALRRSGPKADPLVRARYALLLGDAEQGEALLERSATDDGTPHRRHLGRLSFRRGDFDAAQDHFRAYWEAHDRQRSEAATAIQAWAGSESGDAAYHLLEAGLRTEAEALARTLPQGADRDFVEAVAADFDGQRDVAVAAYRRVLVERPTHIVALERLQRLSEERP